MYVCVRVVEVKVVSVEVSICRFGDVRDFPSQNFQNRYSRPILDIMKCTFTFGLDWLIFHQLNCL
jgi:hypothetical protein